MACLPMVAPRSHFMSPGADARSTLASALDHVMKSPLSPLLDVSCDWLMREAALELLQLPHLGHTPDNHLFKAARAAAASYAGTKQFLANRAVERPSHVASEPSSRRGRKRSRKCRASCKPVLADFVGNQFVMTLFDRSIDLARHTEGTSLYVMCRAWVGDIRHTSGESSYLEIAGISPNVMGREEGDVWTLPPPSPCADDNPDNDSAQESSGGTTMACSSPTQEQRCSVVDTQALDALLEEQSQSPPQSPPALMSQHMRAWRKCRRSKMRRARVEYKRHSKSLSMLRKIRTDVLSMSSTNTLTSLVQ